jgi:hypothetical protein
VPLPRVPVSLSRLRLVADRYSDARASRLLERLAVWSTDLHRSQQPILWGILQDCAATIIRLHSEKCAALEELDALRSPPSKPVALNTRDKRRPALKLCPDFDSDPKNGSGA